MHTHDLSDWIHSHTFDQGSRAAERGTRWVMWITAVMMVFEIIAGWWYNSMALLADGWHMSSHAVALGLSAFAYAAARKYALDPRFAFGTWKIEVLAGFASALFLVGVAAWMVVSSVERLLDTKPIHYQEAIVIAIIGLVVNLVCALILGRSHDDHGHSHGHSHGHDHDHGHAHGPGLSHSRGHPQGSATDMAEKQGLRTAPQSDLNLKAAYLHVMADAATSVLAVIALIGGLVWGWSWLDPVMGIVGAVMVAMWAKGLLIETGKVLLDREMDHPVVEEIREAIETGLDTGHTKVTDLHVWRVGKQVYSCALSVVTHDVTLTPETIRKQLAVHEEIVHCTIEIQFCADVSES
jgi:cation diffusion facilitator family transporter